MATPSALGTNLLKCFDTEGDCKIIVVEKSGQDEDGDEAVSKKRRVEFLVWSKLLSSWSDVFAAMFTHEFKEKLDKKVEIKDFSPASVKAFLQYLYCEVLDVSPSGLVEVASLADIYAVQPLQDVCAQQFEAQLTPENACSMLVVADRLAARATRERCLEMVLQNPSKALPYGFVLGIRLLGEVLESTLLCIEDFSLATLLLEWGKSPATKEKQIDVGELLERNVQLAALTDEQYGKILSLAESVGYGEHVKKMWGRRKRGEHTTDLFAFLGRQFDNKFPVTNARNQARPPFLGYWINLIPSQASFAMKQIRAGFDSSISSNDDSPVGLLGKMARNSTFITLCSNDELKWMLPHHGIHCTGVSFSVALGQGQHVQLYGSADGVHWDLLFDSVLKAQANETGGVTIPCRSKMPLIWFKLCVRKGSYSNSLRISGVVQVVS